MISNLDKDSFIYFFNILQRTAGEIAESKGWEKGNDGEAIATLAKMDFNATREHKHGGKKY